KVRGKVVKFSPQIMGKNWIHIQDGTGEAGSNDLTVTTNTTANVGDTVVISGTLTADKDFGYGYQYSVLVEDAEVATE
ncbi:MAG: nucleotide-binding protein, partial [Desulfuromonadales bacterium]